MRKMPGKEPLEDVKDGKTSRRLAEVVDGFKFQPSPNSCYPNGIHNILKDLSKRHGVGIGLSEQRVNKLVGYTERLGPRLNVVVTNLNAQLRKADYRCGEKTSAKYSELLSILRDEEQSYPLVGVAPDYFNEVAPRYRTVGSADDHVLICLKLTEEEIIVWDGYIHHLGASVRVEGAPGLMRLATGRFLELWDGAWDPSWVFWISREKTQATTLIDFER